VQLCGVIALLRLQPLEQGALERRLNEVWRLFGRRTLV
jgi:hypothetical protein